MNNTEILNLYLKRAGITQEALAKKMGVSMATYWRLTKVNDLQNISVIQAKIIQDSLGITVTTYNNGGKYLVKLK